MCPCTLDGYMTNKRHVVYFAVLLSVLAAYVPFRLLAESYNTVFDASTSGFVYGVAVFIWPAYILLSTMPVSFSGSFLRIPLIARVIVVFLLAGWIDYSALLDEVLGLSVMGRVGLMKTMSSPFDNGVNTTHYSHWLCLGALPFGVVVGEACGWILKRRKLRKKVTEGEKRMRGGVWAVSAHVLTAGVSIPLLASMAGSYAAMLVPADDDGSACMICAFIYVTCLGSGYVGGTFVSLSAIRRRAVVRDARKCTRYSVLAFALLSGVWMAYGMAGLFLKDLGIYAVGLFHLVMVAIFWRLTKGGFSAVEMPSGSTKVRDGTTSEQSV